MQFSKSIEEITEDDPGYRRWKAFRDACYSEATLSEYKELKEWELETGSKVYMGEPLGKTAHREE